ERNHIDVEDALTIKPNVHCSFCVRLRCTYGGFVLFPLFTRWRNRRTAYHIAILRHEFYPQGLAAVKLCSMDGEPIIIILTYTHTAKAFITQSISLFPEYRDTGKARIGILFPSVNDKCLASVAFESKTIILMFFPTCHRMEQFERPVLHRFSINSTVGSKIDILKKDTPHGRLNLCTRTVCLYRQFEVLRKSQMKNKHS